MNPIHSSSSVSKYFNLEARDPAFDEMPFLLRSSGKGGQLYFMLSLSLILFVPVSRQTELIKISTNSFPANACSEVHIIWRKNICCCCRSTLRKCPQCSKFDIFCTVFSSYAASRMPHLSSRINDHPYQRNIGHKWARIEFKALDSQVTAR